MNRVMAVVSGAAAIISAVDAARVLKRRVAPSASGGGPNISIVNGQPAKECEWKWQVGLRDNESSEIWCGGMLIHPEWVLTAAHCADSASFNVVAGEYNVKRSSGNEQSRWAAEVYRHPAYGSAPTRWDFLLVKLERPMEMTKCVGTVPLPEEGADVKPGTECTITGWGTLTKGGKSPNKLQVAQVTTISNRKCWKNFGYARSDITSAMLCAQGEDQNGAVVDACQGDSGGPLVCKATSGTWTLYGATSWGRGCGDAKFPGIWARVHEALGWINEVMEGKLEPASCPDFAVNPLPDPDGDCACPRGQICSTDGGSRPNCPTSGGFGGWGGGFFQGTCKECKCY